jgi:hypothetical protein
MLLATLSVLAALQASAPAPPSARKIVAMLIYVEGAVELREPGGAPRLLTNRDDYLHLSAGDRLKVPPKGRAVVTLSKSGFREEIAPGHEVTIEPDGCAPADAVASRKPLKRSVVDQLAKVPPAPRDGKNAAFQARGPAAARAAVRPINEEILTTDRPEFSWAPVPGATAYRVVFGETDRKPSWTETTDKPRLPFPAGAAPLGRNASFTWTVVANDGPATTVRSTFTMASAGERRLRDDIRPLSESDDPADILAAAACHERLFAYSEALADLERLTRLVPDEPEFASRLARLRVQCGLDRPPATPK